MSKSLDSVQKNPKDMMGKRDLRKPLKILLIKKVGH
jgi:hypothetical protein